MNVGPIINRFTFGECSPLLWARGDLSKYSAGCKELVNFIPLLQGPVQRRGGTRFIAKANNGANPVALLRFVKNESNTFIIEAGNRYLRFYKNGAPVMSGSAPYQITSPWTQANLFDANGLCRLKYVQSADVMWIVCPGQKPQKLSHYGDASWTVAAMPGWGARPNAAAVTLWRERLVMASGNTLYMSQAGAFENFELLEYSVPGFTATYYTDGGGTPSAALDAARGSFKVTFAGANVNNLWVFTIGWDADECNASLSGRTLTLKPKDPKKGIRRVGYLATNNYDDHWNLQSTANAFAGEISSRWDGGGGGTFLFRASFDPQKTAIEVDNATTTSNGKNSGYTIKGAENATAADDPIEIDVYSDTTDDIEWLTPSNSLLVGTSSSEFVVGETTSAEPFGPENCKITPETAFGSSPLQPLRVGSVILFAQRAGRKIREFVYDYAGDNYLALDVTVAAEHITRGGVTDLAWQGEPIETLWGCRKDGTLIGFTYSKDQDMSAWHRHILGGGGLVSQVEVIPSYYGERDELWMSVKRVIGGRTVYYIERLEAGREYGDALADSFYVDCGLTATGSNMTQVTGLAHLEGQTVHILADGGVQPEQVVTGGAVPLKYPAGKVQVGLPYTSRLTTVNLDIPLQDGTIQGRIKRIISATLRLVESLGGAAGHDLDSLERLEYRRGDDRMDQPVALKTGDVKVSWPHGYETEGQLTVAQDYPLPLILAAIIAEVAVEGRN